MNITRQVYTQTEATTVCCMDSKKKFLITKYFKSRLNSSMAYRPGHMCVHEIWWIIFIFVHRKPTPIIFASGCSLAVYFTQERAIYLVFEVTLAHIKCTQVIL